MCWPTGTNLWHRAPVLWAPSSWQSSGPQRSTYPPRDHKPCPCASKPQCHRESRTCYQSWRGTQTWPQMEVMRKGVWSEDLWFARHATNSLQVWLLRSYLSLEMLQSMTVFLLVLTMINGRWMTELAGGGLFVCCSLWRFRCTRFLKAICCNWNNILIFKCSSSTLNNSYKTKEQLLTCKISSWSCDCFCLILSKRLCLSTLKTTQSV